METHKLTVRLPADEVAFVKEYAKLHSITVTEVLHRYLSRLKNAEGFGIHPDVVKLSGIVPPQVDALAEYHQHLAGKHQGGSK